MRSMGHPDYRYRPWTPERRKAASERAKSRAQQRNEPSMNAEPPMAANVVPGWAGRQRKSSKRRWTPKERIKLAEMWGAKLPIELLCEEFDCDAPRIYNKASQMGLPRRTGGAGQRIKAKRRRKALPKADASGQRRFTGVANSQGPRIILAPHDPRSRAGTTVFPTSVVPAGKLARLLKSGHNSRKIGKTVAKGRLRGAPIYTLTLEERGTCPRDCPVWDRCYGNNMPFAHRIWDDGTLTRRLWGELASLAAENPKGFLVRLHVLGDFYSPEYVAFWREALADFPALNIFGFTARRPPDPIGSAIVEMVAANYERCRIRFSGLAMPEDGAVVIERKEDAIGILCPAESRPELSCADCALCWHSNKTISFMRH